VSVKFFQFHPSVRIINVKIFKIYIIFLAKKIKKEKNCKYLSINYVTEFEKNTQAKIFEKDKGILIGFNEKFKRTGKISNN
jgi:hypothetical protein